MRKKINENINVLLKDFNPFSNSVKNNNSENEYGLYIKNLKIEKQNSNINITSNNSYANENLRDYLKNSDVRTILRNYDLKPVMSISDENKENLKQTRAFAKNSLFSITYNKISYLNNKKKQKGFNEKQNNLLQILNALLEKTQDIYSELVYYGYVTLYGEITHDEAARDLNDIMTEYINNLYDQLEIKRKKK